MLWLCIHLPQLPLEALRPTQLEHNPIAVVDAGQRIVSVNTAAAALQPGMLASAACACLPSLLCLPRQEKAEHEALCSLASWCGQFTSWTSLQAPQALLLEIGGSLKLFKSLEQLQKRIAEGLLQLGYTNRLGIAPTPRGAVALALSDLASPISSLTEWRTRARDLPLWAMGWDRKTIQRIQAVGVQTLGECLALPRPGFNKRYGKNRLHELDQMLGLVADPRPAFQAPAVYRRSLDVFNETPSGETLIPGFERLFQDLQAELLGRDCGVLRIHIRLSYGPRHPSSLFHLGLQSPSRDITQWIVLLREHFQHLQIPADVQSIQIYAEEFGEPSQTQQTFWQHTHIAARQALLERLTARLDASALYSLASLPSHSPEKAWEKTAPEQGCDACEELRPRPLWLLDVPVAIHVSQIRNLGEIERLECHWWDQNCQRDYYRAQLSNGQRAWIYREHTQAHEWFVHGFFA